MPPPKNPFDDDENDAPAKADKAAIASLKEKVEAAEPEKAEDEGAIQVDLDAVEEELESEPQRESRNERRRNRYREVQEARTAAERRAEEAERRESETRQMLLNIQQQMQQTRQPAKPEVDPLDAEMDSIFKEMDLQYQAYQAKAQTLSGTEHEQYAERVRQLQRKLIVTGAKIAARDEGGGRAPDLRQIEAMMTAKRLKDEHDDVLSNPQRQAYFDGTWRQLRAEGKPDNWSTIDEAAEITRRRFGLTSKNRQPPSEGYKRKLTGSARGGGGGGDSEPKVVTMTKVHRQMADASFKHIKDPNERYKRWAATAGKKLLDKQG